MTPVGRMPPTTERRIALAGSRPRQQHRPGASRPEKEDAARRRVSRDEAAQILRKAVGTEKSGKIRGDPPGAKAGAQAGGTRRPDPRSEKETAGCEEEA